MNDKPKSKWYWRALRWGLIGLAVLATLTAVLITEEDWRGKHDWEAYKRQAEARGERFDVASVIPPAVPDDQNFFCAPIVAETLLEGRNSAVGSPPILISAPDRYFNLWRGNVASEVNQRGNWQKATLTDLRQWQTAFRNLSETPEGKTNGYPVPAQPQTPAADVSLGLSVFDPAVEQLRQASQRPYARIPLNYDNDFEASSELLPWLATVKRCAQLLELRAQAEEQGGQGAAALADVQLLLRVNDSLRGQPFLISHLVRMAVMAYVIQPVYEGLAQHCWSNAQLMDLEQTLAKEDFLADYRLAMNSEKVFAIDTFERQRITREIKSVVEFDHTNRIEITNLRFMPEAYFYQNELAFARRHQEFIQPLVNFTNRIASPAALSRVLADSQAQWKHYSPYQVQAHMVLPAIVKSVTKFAFVQASVDLARVACALERYRLAQGEYPATLDALAPQFIEKVPHDIVNGQPLHYRLKNDGKFILYSVGWNEKDDGGTVVLNKQGEVEREKGDWVWQYPATPRAAVSRANGQERWRLAGVFPIYRRSLVTGGRGPEKPPPSHFRLFRSKSPSP
jgi:hypothetical protein